MSAIILCGILFPFILNHWQESKKEALWLNDGTQITFETVTFGKEHRYSTGNLLWNRAIRSLPFSWQRKLPRTEVLYYSTSNDELVGWLVRRDATGKYLKPAWSSIQYVDEHGCCFTHRGSYTMNNGALIAQPFSITTYPRRAQQFKLRIYGVQQELLGELTVANPCRTTFPEWKASPLPIVRQDGDFQITLAAVNQRSNSQDMMLEPVLNITRKGETVSDWTWRENIWSDATGNRFFGGGCVKESAWKLDTRLFRSLDAGFTTNEIWTVPVIVPAAATINPWNTVQKLSGVQITIIGLTGAGEITYSNGVPVAATVLPHDHQGDSTIHSDDNGVETIRLACADLQLAIQLDGLSADQRFGLVFVDDQGRRFHGERKGKCGKATIYGVKLPPNVQSGHLELIVQHGLHAEFLFSPSAVIHAK